MKVKEGLVSYIDSREPKEPHIEIVRVETPPAPDK